MKKDCLTEKENIVLIGMPGVGKSTIGVVLAKVLNYQFLDCDILIQSKRNATLQEIINEKGPEGFIEIEGDILSGIEVKRTIIATGGSAVYSKKAMKHLREIGTVVYLKLCLEQIESRLGDLVTRGVVMREGIGKDLKKLFDERIPLYESYAEIIVEVDGIDVEHNVMMVIDSIEERR